MIQKVLIEDAILLMNRRQNNFVDHTTRRYIQNSINRTPAYTTNLSNNLRAASSASSVSSSINNKSTSPILSPKWNFNYLKDSRENNDTNKQWSNYSMPSKKTLEEQQKKYEQKIKQAEIKYASLSNSSIEYKTPLETATTPSVSEAEVPKKRPRRTLRPRKALITLSPKAISHLRSLLDQPDPKLIRIGTKNRGCSGLTYDLQYIEEPGKFDEVVEQDGVKVIIDSKALFSVVGSEMDWIDDTLSSRFVFRNPNSKGTCGCGESFMV